MTLILILIISILIVAIIGGTFYVQIRKVFRQQKNYERGLKMVTLFIHLPPPSDDIVGNGRDARDVIEEAISKAQSMYNVISSTSQSGFKSKFYGQRHLSFEIIGSKGSVYFYAAVPVALVEIVKQAIVTAYPSARLDEVSEHNIFNQLGNINGVSGGVFELKKTYAYPIATYQESKRDGIQALLNALYSLSKEDGAAIQILMRPAHDKWTDHAHEVAETKRNGKSKSKGGIVGEILKTFAVSFVKAPEESKESSEKKKKELSNLEQSNLDSIDEKTRQVGYEVLIRVIVSSNISHRSSSILNNIVSSFSVYDSPNKNGFKFKPAANIEQLTTDYILRIFPQSHSSMILNSTELATIFHFPDQKNIPTSQLSTQTSKQVDGPRDVPDDGILLGYNLFRGAKKPIRLSFNDRQRHMYAVGQTGTGKTVFLENLAFQDMKRGNGFAFIDPHGDVAEKLLAMVPKERVEDVIYFCPGDMDYPMGLNLFEFQSPDQKDFLIQESINMLYKLYDPNRQGMMGARFESLFRNAALTVMADPSGGTIIDIPKLFRDPSYVKQKLQYVTDPTVIEFWQKEIPQSQRSNDFGELVSWFSSKFGAFLSNEMMRNIIGQSKSAFDLRKVMDEKKILIVNLSKGKTGELNSNLLGMIFVMKFQVAAMSRADILEDKRIDFCLYVDEFQNFSTDSFATIMSEARKYHLNLIVANQFTTQLTDVVREAVFGNMGTIVSFRVGHNDVESLTKYFQPVFEAEDLLRIPNFNTIVRTMINGVPTRPFTMATLPSLGVPNLELATILKQLSAAKYGRPRKLVEQEIFDRMLVDTSSGAANRIGAFNNMGSANMASNSPFNMPSQTTTLPGGYSSTPYSTTSNTMSTAATRPPAQANNSSFLDDFLRKRSAYKQQVKTTAPINKSSSSPMPSQQMPQQQPTSLFPSTGPSNTAQAPINNTAASTTPNSIVQPQSLIPSSSLPDVSNNLNQATHNISSEVLDKQEADNIAKELENNFTSSTSIPDKSPVSIPNVDNSNKQTSDDLSKLKGSQLNHNDTIYIDRDGILHDVNSNS